MDTPGVETADLDIQGDHFRRDVDGIGKHVQPPHRGHGLTLFGSSSRLQGKYDRASSNLSYRYYLAGLGYDRVRDSDRRVELGYGIGRPLIDAPANLLTAEVGLAYVAEEFGTGDSESDAKLRVGEGWLRQLGAEAELRQSLAVLSALGDLGDLTSEFVLALTQPLSSSLAFTTKLVNTYDSRPVEGTKRSDYTLTAQIGLAFGD